MKVEHIIWQDYHRGDVKGILELEIFHHGDDEPTTCIMEGTYFEKNRCFQNFALGIKIDGDTLGVSVVSVNRVGQLVD